MPRCNLAIRSPAAKHCWCGGDAFHLLLGGSAVPPTIISGFSDPASHMQVLMQHLSLPLRSLPAQVWLEPCTLVPSIQGGPLNPEFCMMMLAIPLHKKYARTAELHMLTKVLFDCRWRKRSDLQSRAAGQEQSAWIGGGL